MKNPITVHTESDVRFVADILSVNREKAEAIVEAVTSVLDISGLDAAMRIVYTIDEYGVVNTLRLLSMTENETERFIDRKGCHPFTELLSSIGQNTLAEYSTYMENSEEYTAYSENMSEEAKRQYFAPYEEYFGKLWSQSAEYPETPAFDEEAYMHDRIALYKEAGIAITV